MTQNSLKKSMLSLEKEIQEANESTSEQAVSIEELKNNQEKEFNGTINEDPYFNDINSWNEKR